MGLNENIVKGKWKEIKGDLRKAWGNLTDDELEKTKGDMKSVAGLIQKKYGESEEKAKEKLDKIYSRYDEKRNSAVNSVKDNF